MLSTYLLALLVAGAQAAVLTLQSPLLSVTTSGTQSRREAYVLLGIWIDRDF